MRRLHHCLVAGVAAMLTACAVAPTREPVPSPEATWGQHRKLLGEFDSWEAAGKLAVNTHQRGGSASMIWRRDREDHYVNLYGPLGSGRVVLTRDTSGARLQDGKKVVQGKSAEDVLYRAVGWRVPFAAMQYWILGVPAPKLDYTKTLDAYGRLEKLQQDGWDIQFLEYQMFAQQELPRKMVLTALPGSMHLRDEPLEESDRVEVKVIIKNWKL